MVDNRGRVVRCRGRSIGWSMVGYRVCNRVNSMVDNRMSNRVDSMVGYRVDSMVGHRVDSMVGYRVNSMVGNRVNSMVGNWVDNWSMMSNPKMRSMAAMRHNSTMTMTDYMGRHIRCGCCSCETKKSQSSKSLKMKKYVRYLGKYHSNGFEKKIIMLCNPFSFL